MIALLVPTATVPLQFSTLIVVFLTICLGLPRLPGYSSDIRNKKKKACCTG